MSKRILLLLTSQTYRAVAFLAAAKQLDVEVVTAIDMPHALTKIWHEQRGLDFSDLDASTASIVALHAATPLDAIIAVDDSGSLLAACASAALGLPHNAPHAAEAARDKYIMRTLLKQGGVQVPEFRLCSTGNDLHELATQVVYPCVVKPLRLAGSQGVMRADDPAQFVAATTRLKRLLDTLEGTTTPKPFLVEAFIPGFEVALEGLLDHGQLQVLALFDKPDPLDGPFFEETIYVTPSRLSETVQAAITQCAADAAAALGLREGPMHAEMRVNERGPWLVEVAGRSIGGLCSQTLQFGTALSLEELIVRQACGLLLDADEHTGAAGGVMMIPIPGAGILKCVNGVEAAQTVVNVTDITITAKTHYPLVPLPEGDSYLGFIFARADTAEHVEAALREAHAHLHFELMPDIPLL